MKEILEMVATYGLPIVLTIWFVCRIDVMLTKLVKLLEAFIAWLKEKEEDKNKKREELKSGITILHDQMAELINRIKILEVRLER